MKKRRSNSGFIHVYSVVGKFLLLLLGFSSSVSGHTAYVGIDSLDSTQISEKGFESKNTNSKILITEGTTIVGMSTHL